MIYFHPIPPLLCGTITVNMNKLGARTILLLHTTPRLYLFYHNHS